MYERVSAGLMLGVNPVMDQHPIQGGVEILLVASCYRNWDKLCPDGSQLACIQTLLLPLPVPLGSGKNFKQHPLKGLFKISDEQLCLLYGSSAPPPPPAHFCAQTLIYI